METTVITGASSGIGKAMAEILLEQGSGANIIIVTEALKGDLASVEKLYGFNTTTQQLTKL
jgi:NAD(P)-dependent dehydrogenase (short-subunit alcohol dehydrogenase family)